MRDLDKAGCFICGEQVFTNLVEAPDFEYACKPGVFSVARCNSCGHVFSNPTPAPEQIPSLYPRTYYTVNPRSPLFLQGPIYRAKVRGDARRIEKVTRGRRPRSILDVGCGDAERLIELRRRWGADPTIAGVDLQVTDAIGARCAQYNIELFEANIEVGLGELGDRKFDFILMAQLIEHLGDPRAGIKNVAKLLNPGGRVLIETPNLGGLDHWLFKRRYWGGYHIPRHLHLFCHQSLAQLTESCGLRVVRQGSLPSPGFWIISVRNKLGLNSAERSRSFFEWINFSNLFAVGFFTAIDLVTSSAGVATSNQYVIAEKPNQ